MANTTTMIDPHFESKKNWQPTTYTAAVLSILLLLFIFYRWPLTSFVTPILEEGIEVNLGNSDQGLGDDQPFEPGSPSPADQQAYTPPAPAEQEKEEVKDIATDDKDEDAPVIKNTE